MRGQFRLTVLLTGTLVVSVPPLRAQDAEMLRHFDYEQRAPLGIKHVGVKHRERATIYDITYDGPKVGVVPAYLVVPKGRTLAQSSATQSRREEVERILREFQE